MSSSLMKILQVNGYESPGRRFSGLSITPLLKKYGIESRHLIWEKDTQNPEILTFEGAIARKINRVINKIERITSLQSVLHLNASRMIKMPAFKEADLIHLHIISSGYFSISDLSKITKLKPTVWTLHDPWAMTGHCIHPFDCKRWMTGCGNCPDLTSHIPLAKDNTRFLFNYKRAAYKRSDFDIIVASKWMQDMVNNSPMFENKLVHLVPFGLDLNFFSAAACPNARKLFDILGNALVICFRVEQNEFKGVPYIIQALERIKSKQPICLLTLSSGGALLQQFADRFQIVNLGWTNDEELVREALVAADIFLMPSVAEAFGMMAIEAFKKSGATYLLTTTFVNRRLNEELKETFWRVLNLQQPPFNFPKPILLVNEGCTEDGDLYSDKSLGLWLLKDISLSFRQVM
jgi:glycosyltransferase involved in cell wall biosynthesis